MQNLKLKIIAAALISILSTSKILFLLIRGIPTGRDELSTPASKYTGECSGEKSFITMALSRPYRIQGDYQVLSLPPEFPL